MDLTFREVALRPTANTWQNSRLRSRSSDSSYKTFSSTCYETGPLKSPYIRWSLTRDKAQTIVSFEPRSKDHQIYLQEKIILNEEKASNKNSQVTEVPQVCVMTPNSSTLYIVLKEENK
jgi:hypothetical protein